jgi:hypothetical protein
LYDTKAAINIKSRHGCEANTEAGCTALANKIEPQKIGASKSCSPKIALQSAEENFKLPDRGHWRLGGRA